jgi:hypothetical protein
MTIELIDFADYEFSAIIKNKRCSGVIQVEDAGVYLCQDRVSGAQADNKHGFKRSYYVERGSSEDLKKYMVRGLKIKI